MEGQTLSHYKVGERLGGGGMGVVYKALDTKLNRHVALKCLAIFLCRDDDARQRFIQEAQAASALDHPNICTTYEIDSTPDGQMFIAMAFYDGGTLKQRIARGRMPVAEAIDVAIQIAQGLVQAHEAGIVHRDIKPANVMLTQDGLVKIVDFGIAKLLGVTGPTEVGSTLGTLAYMSPEQFEGEDADERSDVWSLGAVLYELLTEQCAFQGENHWAVMAAVTNRDPELPSEVSKGIPAEVDELILRALKKQKSDRFASAGDFLDAAKACHRSITGTSAGVSQSTRSWAGPRVRVAVSMVVVLALLGVGWSVNRLLDRRWARGEAVLEAQQLADAGDFAAALELGLRALEVAPDLPELINLLEVVSETPVIETDPPGAIVSVKDYADADGPWVEVGTTPLSGVPVPAGRKRWRIELEGYETLQLAADGDLEATWTLPPTGSIPDGMVWVPGDTAGAFITGMGPLVPLPYSDYYIDRFEVTNEAYLAFVEAGGYEREELWKYDFVDAGRRLTWTEAMDLFEDATGLTGPATWELGRPKAGEESLPVTGVSWYEAAAYAEFVGKSVPTLRHWVQAAGTRAGGSIIPLSNFSANGPAEAGTFAGMSPFGAFDMAGNVREWVLNTAGDRRHAVGGAWSDQTYFFSGPNVQPAFERLSTNGFRLAQYTQTGDFEGEAEVDMPLLTRAYYEEQPVSDDVFSFYAAQFDYDPADLDVEVEETIEYEHGTIERVSFAGVGWGRIHAYLYLPARFEAPYQTVVWFPGSSAARLQPDPDPRTVSRIQHFVASGRAVLWPVVRSTFSRADADQPPGMNTTWPQPSREYVDLVRSWVSEVRRSVDFLESRPEIDAEKIAYYGISWGGRLGAIIPAVEPRFKVNMVMIGGLASGKALDQVDQINYVTRVTIPTLMLNGRHDPLQPVESSQDPMYDLLGTPQAEKRHRVFEGYGHGLPPNERARETLAWLDRFFGPPS